MPDRALRRLGLFTVGDVMDLGPHTQGPSVRASTILRDALSLLLAEGARGDPGVRRAR